MCEVKKSSIIVAIVLTLIVGGVVVIQNVGKVKTSEGMTDVSEGTQPIFIDNGYEELETTQPSDYMLDDE